MEQLTISMWSLALLVFVALAFDFMNGFHDGANSISTIVATGALTPKQAVVVRRLLQFCRALGLPAQGGRDDRQGNGRPDRSSTTT